VGDGDFSFSLSIAQGRQSSDNEDIQEVRKFYATSHESHDTVTSVYPQCSDTLNKLRKLNVKIFHDIDATNLAQSGNIPKGSFDIICWNFPCIRHEAGADGQVSELEANKDLVRRFFENVRPFLREKGMREIHVTHKTIEPFSWWGIIDIAKECDMEHLGSVVFDRCLYQGYTNRKALDKKSFPLHDARTYIFRVPGESNTKQSTFERHPHIVGLGCADTRRVLESKLKSLYGECEDTKREANDAIHSIGGKRSGDEAYSETIASNSDRKTKKKKI
jgi:25S rRNA (uracil2634-N3)-methyltransferase